MREAASPQPPPLSAADADLIAERVAARVVDAVTDPQTVQRVTEAWSGAIERLLGHEGGYVDNPRDPGGETKYGISRRSYPGEDIAGMTLERAKAIYRRDCWGPAGCDAVPDALRFDLFDAAVNSGVPAAIRLLQRARRYAMDSRTPRVEMLDNDQGGFVLGDSQIQPGVVMRNGLEVKITTGRQMRAKRYIRGQAGEYFAGFGGGATYLQPRDPRILLEPA